MFSRRLTCDRAVALTAALLALTISALLLVSAISAVCNGGAKAAPSLNACMERSLNASVTFHGDILQRATLDTLAPFIIAIAAIAAIITGAVVVSAPQIRDRLIRLRWVWSRRHPFSSTQRYTPTYAASHGG